MKSLSTTLARMIAFPIVLKWPHVIVLLMILVVPFHAEATLLTFDELPSQPVDGLSYQGITFGFSVGGSASTDAYYHGYGPVRTTYVTDPSLEGNSAGSLSLQFAVPTNTLNFGLAINNVGNFSSGARVQLFDSNNAFLGTRDLNTSSVTTNPAIAPFSSGEFNYFGPQISRAIIQPNSNIANRFALDNLAFNAIPLSNHDLFVSGFNALATNQAMSTPFTSRQQLLDSQQVALTIADTTLTAAQGTGTLQQDRVRHVDINQVFEVVMDLQGLMQSLLDLSVDPFLPAIFCPQGNCLFPVITGDRIIRASSYEVFDYDLPIQVGVNDLAFFHPGDRYIVNSSVLGFTPSFSMFEVSNITGTTVDMYVRNMSEIPEVVPEPPTLFLVGAGLAILGIFSRRIRLSGQ